LVHGELRVARSGSPLIADFNKQRDKSNKIKIDRPSQSVGRLSQDAAIVRAIAHLSRDLDIDWSRKR